MAKDIKRPNRVVVDEEPKYLKTLPASRRRDQRQWLLKGVPLFSRWQATRPAKSQNLDPRRKANKWVLRKAVAELEKEEAAA